MPHPDEIRAQLVREIERRQQQLDALRDALRSLDSALEAAAAAHAASMAAIEKSMGPQVAAATRMAKSATHAVAKVPSAEGGERRRDGSSGKPPEGVGERRRRPRGNSGMMAAATVPAAAPPTPAPAPIPAPQIVLETPTQPAAPVAPVVPAAPPAVAAPAAVAAPPVAERQSGEEKPAVPSLRSMNLGRYANMKVWRAVQHVLTEKRRAMTFEEIVHCLQEGGASLGPSPMRTVTTAVGYMNDKIFHVSKHNNVTTVSVLQPFQ